ncbi:DUF3168 domain-containing protein [Devosia sp. A449]
MTEPSLALQIAIRAALVASPAVLDLVPADHIVDHSARPENFPAIIVGDGQTVREDLTYARRHVRVVADLHVWTVEGGLAFVKEVAGTIEAALRTKPALTSHHLVDFRLTGTRYLRDPAGEHGHAIVAVEALLEEIL